MLSASTTPARGRRSRFVIALVVSLLATGTVIGAPDRADAAGTTVVGVVREAGIPQPDLVVNLRSTTTGSGMPSEHTDVDGRFVFADVPPGRYELYVLDNRSFGAGDPGWAMTWLGDVPGRTGATPVVVGGAPVDVGAVNMIRAAGITGTVDRPPGPVGDLAVETYWLDPVSGLLHPIAARGIHLDGTFVAPKLPPGDILVRVAPRDLAVQLSVGYPGGASRWWDASLVTVEAGGVYDVGAIEVVAHERVASDRFGGADRFGTGVALSEWAIPDDADVGTVFVASGTAFPDALAAGPIAAADGSPLLLVRPDAVPAAVWTELERLDPDRIVIVGGTGAVSAAVATRLSTIAPVQRESGSTRYATADAVIRLGFGEIGADTAVLATGANFPDALAAGPLASALGAPVVLVPPGGSLDAATRKLLVDLGVSRVILAGGTGAISSGIESGLASVPGIVRVERVSGADRYATAAVLATMHPLPPDEVFLASGTAFPDALSAGWIAGALSSPIALARPACIPASTAAVLGSTMDIHLVGGSGALSPAVAALAVCPE